MTEDGIPRLCRAPANILAVPRRQMWLCRVGKFLAVPCQDRIPADAVPRPEGEQAQAHLSAIARLLHLAGQELASYNVYSPGRTSMAGSGKRKMLSSASAKGGGRAVKMPRADGLALLHMAAEAREESAPSKKYASYLVWVGFDRGSFYTKIKATVFGVTEAGHRTTVRQLEMSHSSAVYRQQDGTFTQTGGPDLVVINCIKAAIGQDEDKVREALPGYAVRTDAHGIVRVTVG